MIRWLRNALFGKIKPWHWDYKYCRIDNKYGGCFWEITPEGVYADT